MGEARSEVWERRLEARPHIDFVLSIYNETKSASVLTPPTQMWLRWRIYKVKRARYAGGKLSAPAEHSNASACLQVA